MFRILSVVAAPALAAVVGSKSASKIEADDVNVDVKVNVGGSGPTPPPTPPGPKPTPPPGPKPTPPPNPKPTPPPKPKPTPPPKPVSLLDRVYSALKNFWPQYDGQTYAAPTTNVWNGLIPTPNIFGLNLTTYEESFTPQAGFVVDRKFEMPTCKTNAHCNGYAKCKRPTYTTDPSGKVIDGLCTNRAHDMLQAML